MVKTRKVSEKIDTSESESETNEISGDIRPTTITFASGMMYLNELPWDRLAFRPFLKESCAGNGYVEIYHDSIPIGVECSQGHQHTNHRYLKCLKQLN